MFAPVAPIIKQVILCLMDLWDGSDHGNSYDVKDLWVCSVLVAAFIKIDFGRWACTYRTNPSTEALVQNLTTRHAAPPGLREFARQTIVFE